MTYICSNCEKENTDFADCECNGVLKEGYVLEEDCHCFCCGEHEGKD